MTFCVTHAQGLLKSIALATVCYASLPDTWVVGIEMAERAHVSASTAADPARAWASAALALLIGTCGVYLARAVTHRVQPPPDGTTTPWSHALLGSALVLALVLGAAHQRGLVDFVQTTECRPNCDGAGLLPWRAQQSETFAESSEWLLGTPHYFPRLEALRLAWVYPSATWQRTVALVALASVLPCLAATSLLRGRWAAAQRHSRSLAATLALLGMAVITGIGCVSAVRVRDGSGFGYQQLDGLLLAQVIGFVFGVAVAISFLVFGKSRPHLGWWLVLAGAAAGLRLSLDSCVNTDRWDRVGTDGVLIRFWPQLALLTTCATLWVYQCATVASVGRRHAGHAAVLVSSALVLAGGLALALDSRFYFDPQQRVWPNLSSVSKCNAAPHGYHVSSLEGFAHDFDPRRGLYSTRGEEWELFRDALVARSPQPLQLGHNVLLAALASTPSADARGVLKGAAAAGFDVYLMVQRRQLERTLTLGGVWRSLESCVLGPLRLEALGAQPPSSPAGGEQVLADLLPAEQRSVLQR